MHCALSPLPRPGPHHQQQRDTQTGLCSPKSPALRDRWACAVLGRLTLAKPPCPQRGAPVILASDLITSMVTDSDADHLISTPVGSSSCCSQAGTLSPCHHRHPRTLGARLPSEYSGQQHQEEAGRESRQPGTWGFPTSRSRAAPQEFRAWLSLACRYLSKWSVCRGASSTLTSPCGSHGLLALSGAPRAPGSRLGGDHSPSSTGPRGPSCAALTPQTSALSGVFEFLSHCGLVPAAAPLDERTLTSRRWVTGGQDPASKEQCWTRIVQKGKRRQLPPHCPG